MFDDLGWPHGGNNEGSAICQSYSSLSYGGHECLQITPRQSIQSLPSYFTFMPQMSTSCCRRRKSPQEDGLSHQAVSCGDNEWLLQSIKSLLRNFRSGQSRWSATTIALRWATLPHQGLNPPELTKDTRGRCAQEVPGSYDGWQSPFGALNQILEMHFSDNFFSALVSPP